MGNQGYSFPSLMQPLNQLAAPLIKNGLGSPLPFSSGLVVLEIPGRKTGRRYTLPLVGWLAPGRLVVGTVRSESQWVRNLGAVDEVKLWLWGREMRGTPTVFVNGQRQGSRAGQTVGLVAGLATLSDTLGVALAELALEPLGKAAAA
jgi:hypothetical protein